MRKFEAETDDRLRRFDSCVGRKSSGLLAGNAACSGLGLACSWQLSALIVWHGKGSKEIDVCKMIVDPRDSYRRACNLWRKDKMKVRRMFFYD